MGCPQSGRGRGQKNSVIIPSQNNNIKSFDDANEEWLDFVVNCRNGSGQFKQYDAIVGKVADDDIFKCVSMYMDGHWDVRRTLNEIRYYKNYDQIAFIKQGIIDEALCFMDAYEVQI